MFHKLLQEQLIQEVAEVEDQEQQLHKLQVQEDQELLLLNKFVHHQHIKTHPESGHLMTHIITRKAERGYHHRQH
jgi:hypothetical protein